MGLVVGLLRKTNEVISMIVGVLVETLIFFVADWFLFGFNIALITLGTLVDLIYVPISYGVIKGIRKALKTTYLA
jgi:type IV secretory pathway TrbD component